MKRSVSLGGVRVTRHRFDRWCQKHNIGADDRHFHAAALYVADVHARRTCRTVGLGEIAAPARNGGNVDAAGVITSIRYVLRQDGHPDVEFDVTTDTADALDLTLFDTKEMTS